MSNYRLAELARHKLLHEASQPDHNYRLLVLHANLLDNLLEELEVEEDLARRKEQIRRLERLHARLHGSTEPVVFLEGVKEGYGYEYVGKRETGEEDVPSLSPHGSESEEEDVSEDDDHEEGNAEVHSGKASEGEVESLKEWDEEYELRLHRTTSHGAGLSR